jgi:hypothetical protein
MCRLGNFVVHPKNFIYQLYKKFNYAAELPEKWDIFCESRKYSDMLSNMDLNTLITEQIRSNSTAKTPIWSLRMT